MSERRWSDVTSTARPYLYDDVLYLRCVCGELGIAMTRTDQPVRCGICGREYRLKVEVRSPGLPEGE